MAFNIMSGCMNEEKKERGNAMLRAMRSNYDGLKAGNKEYRESIFKEQGAYDPSKDSGQHLTGYQQQERDPFSATANFAEAGAAHGVTFNTDALTSAAAQNVSVDARTGVTTVSEDLYGKVDYGPEGRSFFETGLSLVGSVMDTFVAKDQMLNPNQTMYASSGNGVFDTGGGLFAGFGAQTAAFNGGVGGGVNQRLDQFGNVIRTEGIQDYVEEGGRRFNLDFAGNRTETDAFGNAIANGNDVNSFYSNAGWNSESGSWNNNSVAGFYGTSPAASTTGSIYASYTQPENTGGIWGTTAAADTSQGNIWGTGGGAWGGTTNPEPQQNSFWGTTSVASADPASIYGTTGNSTSTDPMSSFYGHHRKNDWA